MRTTAVFFGENGLLELFCGVLLRRRWRQHGPFEFQGVLKFGSSSCSVWTTGLATHHFKKSS